MAVVLHQKAPRAVKVGIAKGLLVAWHWHELRRSGLSVVYLHLRHAEAALSAQLNETDANDAFCLAQIVCRGWYQEVGVKSMENHKLRLLLAVRARLVSIRTTLYSETRGLLKTFGVVLTTGKGRTFERLVIKGVPEDRYVRLVIESLMAT